MVNEQPQPKPHERTPRVPTLTRHKRTGQGYVRLNGRCYYLGRYEDPATQGRYHQRIAEWMALGRQLPVEQEAITVLELCSRFWRHAEGYYRRRRRPRSPRHPPQLPTLPDSSGRLCKSTRPTRTTTPAVCAPGL